MIRFQCDYAEGAHPLILQKMAETNAEQTVGYGNDPYCECARKKIRTLCDAPEADVHFLVGGTQTNFISHSFDSSSVSGGGCGQYRAYQCA